MRSIALILAGASLVSCRSATPVIENNPVTTEVEAAPALTPLAEQMQKHWGLTTWVRDAIVAGQIDEVPQAAGMLADHDPGPAVPDWTPFVAQMRTHAKAAEQGETVNDIAAATGLLAATCGECHVSTGAVVTLEADAPPESGLGARAHMLRHAWAASAWWDALIAPSDDRWTQGADVFAERPLHETEFFTGWVVTPELARLGVAVHDIGVRGRTANSTAERAALYGELLVTCAECHAATGSGPP